MSANTMWGLGVAMATAAATLRAAVRRRSAVGSMVGAGGAGGRWSWSESERRLWYGLLPSVSFDFDFLNFPVLFAFWPLQTGMAGTGEPSN